MQHPVRENGVFLVLWCNGSTRDFGSLRDCSIQSRTTHLLDKKYFFHLCTSACESSSALFIIHFFKCFFYLNNLFFSQLLVISR